MKDRVSVLQIGLVRGLFGMVLGVLFGLGLVSGIRALLGLPFWNPEAAWVVAGVFGTIGFMLMVGVLRDWIKWALGEETPDFPESDARLKGWAKYLSVSYDHKIIGIQYGVTA